MLAIISSVGDLTAGNRRAEWMGMVNGGASVDRILGPVLDGLLYDRFGYVMPFGAAITTAVATLLLAVLLIPDTHRPSIHPGRPRLVWMH